MTARGWLGLLAIVLATPAVRAEPVFVIEQLVVSVASAPGADGEKVGTVKSGDRLELIERQDDEAHVRLANGTEGWLKASYLSADQPLARRLADRTAEVDKLKQDVTRLESDLAAAKAARAADPRPPPPSAVSNSRNTAAASNSAGNPYAAPTQAPPTSEHDATVFLRTPDEPTRPLWVWVLGTTIVMLLIGFALGWRTLDRRIRQKYGGLRIY